MKQIKVLAFDTGGTVLDWHAGLTAAMAAWGTAHGIKRDWHALANEHRRRSLRRMTATVDPGERSQSVGTSLTRGRILLRRCAGCASTASASRSRSSACR